MRRLGSLILAVLAVTGLVAAEASAGTITLETKSTYTSLPGGEFGVTDFTSLGVVLDSIDGKVRYPNSTNPTTIFQTFCLEKNEYFKPGTEYEWILNYGAVYGGVGGYDPLDARTAYLYTEFWKGNLSNYNYTFGSGRVASAAELQEAIWYIEGEISSCNGQAATWVQEAQDEIDAGDWTGLDKVMVLNIYQKGHLNDPSYRVQDQLIIVKSFDDTEVVPLPAAAYMGGVLMAGILAISRLRRRGKNS